MNNKAIIESILYTLGSDGVNLLTLKKILNIPTQEIRIALKDLSNEMDHNENCGLCIKKYGDRFYLLTKETNNPYLEKLINIKTKNPLSSSLLESLAIIAYNQPCTKTKIEEIRNIDSTFAIDKLVEFGLIENIGKAKTPGNPYLYQVTQKFFETFGLKSIDELPKIDDINFDITDNDVNFFDSSR